MSSDLMAKNISIRTANISDALDISYVHVESWRSAYEGIISNDYLQKISVCERENRWRSILSMESSKTYVAEFNRKIVAFINFGPYRGESFLNHGEIYAIYSVREVWGSYVGSDLMNKVILELLENKYKKISVNVLSRNIRGVSFYKKHGFSVTTASGRILAIGDTMLEEIEMMLSIPE